MWSSLLRSVTMRHTYKLTGLFCMLLISGCASMTSQSVGTSPPPGGRAGLLYFLPQRDLLVEYDTRSPDGQCQSVFRVGVSEPYADRAQSFMADLPSMFLGHNASFLTVAENGLLDNAESYAQSTLTEIIVAAAEGGARLSFDRNSADGVIATSESCPDLALAWRIPIPVKSGNLGNGLTVAVDADGTRRFDYSAWHSHWTLRLESPPVDVSNSAATKKPAAGIYYRANVPYRVSIHSDGAIETHAVSLPNESPILLASAPRSLFGGKRATMTFDHGTLVGYSVDLEGDGLQLVSLPVRVLAAMSGAAGELFSFRRSSAQGEAAAIEAELALETARLTIARCQAALQSDDMNEIREHCGT